MGSRPQGSTHVSTLPPATPSPSQTQDAAARFVAQKVLLAVMHRKQPLMAGLSDGMTAHAVTLVDVLEVEGEYRIVYQDHFPPADGTFLQANRNTLGICAKLEADLGNRSMWSISEEEFFRLDREIYGIELPVGDPTRDILPLTTSCEDTAGGMRVLVQSRVEFSLLLEPGTARCEANNRQNSWILVQGAHRYEIDLRLFRLPEEVSKQHSRGLSTDVDTILQYAFGMIANAQCGRTQFIAWQFVQEGEYPTGEPYLLIGLSVGTSEHAGSLSPLSPAHSASVVHGVTLHGDVVIDVSVLGVGATVDPSILICKARRVMLGIHRCGTPGHQWRDHFASMANKRKRDNQHEDARVSAEPRPSVPPEEPSS